MRKLLISVLGSATLLVAACAVHKVEVQQGNVIEEKNVAQLKPGMTRKQVRFLMGTPLVEDPFHHNRWDYIYSLRIEGKLEMQARVTMFFDGDTLVRVLKSDAGNAAASDESPK